MEFEIGGIRVVKASATEHAKDYYYDVGVMIGKQRMKKVRLSNADALKLAEALCECVSGRIGFGDGKIDATVLAPNKCGVKRFHHLYGESVQKVALKLKGQPRVWLDREQAGFVALELRECSSVPLRTSKEMDEYFKQKLLQDV